MKQGRASWLLTTSLAVCVSGPAVSQVPVIDRANLALGAASDQTSREIEKTDNDRFSVSKSVTCSIYRQGRTGDAISAAMANPEIISLVKRVAREENADERLFLALIYQESRFNPCARSLAGAVGLAQLMPETARELGVNPYDMEDNLRGGARYLKLQLERFDGNMDLALAAYNAGPGSIQTYGGIPPFKETQGYVAAIKQKWLPAFGGADLAEIPVNHGSGSIAFSQLRDATINSMATSQATADSSRNVASWLQQLGQMSSGTIQDSWDHNSGSRNANLEMINQIILLGSTMADLLNSRRALEADGLSGSSRADDFHNDDEAKDRDTTDACDSHQGLEWSPGKKACVQKRQREADIALMFNAE